jgi:hypothetical protein
MASWQLVVDDVTKRFGGVEAVSHVSLTLEEHVTVLDWGRKIAEGTAQEVARDPRVVEVYLGSGGSTADDEAPSTTESCARFGRWTWRSVQARSSRCWARLARAFGRRVAPTSTNQPN